MRTVVDPDDFEKALRQAVGRIQRHAEAAAAEACNHAMQVAVELTDDLGLTNNAVGGYKSAWYAKKIRNGAEYGNTAPYAGVLEHGRRPGATPPPIEPIRAWVRKKLKVHDEGEIDRIAEAVVWKIHKLGTRPYHIHRMTSQALPRYYRQALRERLE